MGTVSEVFKAYAPVVKTIGKQFIGQATANDVLNSMDQALEAASQLTSSPEVIAPLKEAQAQRRERINKAGKGNNTGPFLLFKK